MVVMLAVVTVSVFKPGVCGPLAGVCMPGFLELLLSTNVCMCGLCVCVVPKDINN